MEVAIIIGSDSDWKVMSKAAEVLKEFGIDAEITVASAHRTPEKVRDFVKNSSAKVFIAAAGMAAHLAGVVASFTTKPVISTVQMPGGVPVATMAVNGAKNAALFAVEILALSDKNLEKKLSDYRAKMAAEVEEKSKLVTGGNFS